MKTKTLWNIAQSIDYDDDHVSRKNCLTCLCIHEELQAAYRAGQEAMRERAAALLSEWDCDCEFDDDRERCASCSVDIRALPIEDKP